MATKKTQSQDNKLSLRMDKQLRHIQVGDRVAVVRKESGVLHFFVNSEDQVEHIFYTKTKKNDKDISTGKKTKTIRKMHSSVI